jgi:hypothetical protein
MRLVRFVTIFVACLASVLFVAVAALYVRSIWIADTVTHVVVVRNGKPAGLRGVKMRSYRGTLFFGAITCDEDSGIYDRGDLGWRATRAAAARISLPNATNALERLGFFIGREGGPPVNPWRQTYAHVPHWALLALLGGLSVPLWMKVHRAHRSTRRAAAGLCVACGYDLRASPSECPECGRVAFSSNVGRR